MKIRIVLVDDHQMMRDGLRMILEKKDFSVVTEASDVQSALDCVKQSEPDLVVLDLHLRGEDGISATRKILQARPNSKVLILSADPSAAAVSAALRAGASGYLAKDEASAELVRAAEVVMSGNVYLCPVAATAAAEAIKKQVDPEKPRLSDRESETLKLVVEGLRNKEIADCLKVSTKSVETYRSRLMSKLGCSSTAELVRYAVREGLAAL